MECGVDKMIISSQERNNIYYTEDCIKKLEEYHEKNGCENHSDSCQYFQHINRLLDEIKLSK